MEILFNDKEAEFVSIIEKLKHIAKNKTFLFTLLNYQFPVKVFHTLIHLTNFRHCSNQVTKSDEKTLFGKARQVFLEAGGNTGYGSAVKRPWGNGCV